MIDTSHIGALISRHTVDVEAGRLRFFAKATGQNDARYIDAEAGQAAGYPALPVPPTFLFCLEMDVDDDGAEGQPQICVANIETLPRFARKPVDMLVEDGLGRQD